MNAGSHHRRPPRRAGWLAVALAGTALLATACGGAAKAAPAAHPGQITVQEMDSFAACMRTHGEPDFYFTRASNSTLTSVLKLGPWVAPADPGSPQFQAAMKACRHLLPLPPLTPAVQQQQLQRMVRAAACMRAHGYPDYPDPSAQPGGGIMQPPLPSGIDTSSPQFQAAEQACNGG